MKLNVASEKIDTTVQLDTLDDDTGGGSVGGGDSSTEGAGDYELNNLEYSTNGGGTRLLGDRRRNFDEVKIPNGRDVDSSSGSIPSRTRPKPTTMLSRHSASRS